MSQEPSRLALSRFYPVNVVTQLNPLWSKTTRRLCEDSITLHSVNKLLESRIEQSIVVIQGMLSFVSLCLLKNWTLSGSGCIASVSLMARLNIPLIVSPLFFSVTTSYSIRGGLRRDWDWDMSLHGCAYSTFFTCILKLSWVRQALALVLTTPSTAFGDKSTGRKSSRAFLMGWDAVPPTVAASIAAQVCLLQFIGILKLNRL